MATFLDLPEVLHRHIAFYLQPARLRAALTGIGSTSHIYREGYASQVTSLVFPKKNLRTPDGIYTERILDAHACVLARVLSHFSVLTSIECWAGGTKCSAPEVLGRALLRSRALVQLKRLYTMVFLSHFQKNSVSKYYQSPIPYSLAKALAQGKLPLLEELYLYEDVWWLQNEELRALMTEAMLAGHLANLKHMTMEGGLHVACFLSAYRACLEGDSQQANIEKLIVGPILPRGNDWVQSRFYGPLSQFLELPSLNKLRVLNISCVRFRFRVHFEEAVQEQLTILARYIGYTNGAPCLQELTITLSSSEPDFGPLVTPLIEGGLPNLDWLTIRSIGGRALQQLGDICSRGGFANVKRVTLVGLRLTKASIRTWMDGELASEHRGAALERLELSVSNGASVDDCAAFQVLVEALSEGVFPDLQALDATSDTFMRKLESIDGEEFWASFIQAMRDGAPCARTLRKLWVDVTLSEEQRAELQTVLPQAEIPLRQP